MKKPAGTMAALLLTAWLGTWGGNTYAADCTAVNLLGSQNWRSSLTWALGGCGLLGLLYPTSVDNVIINSGHTVIVDNTNAANTITINGGRLEFNAGQSLTVTNGITSSGTVALGSGIFNANGAFSSSGTVTSTTGTLNIKGNTTLSGTFTPGSGTVTFNGASNQSVSGSALGFNNVTVNNLNGITIGNNLTASGTLTFTSGKITTGANKVTVGTAGTATGAGSTTGYVAGCLEKMFSGAGSFTFVIGDATVYAPVGVTTSGAGNLTWCTTAGDHPNIATSSLAPNFTVNRYWAATSTSVPTYSATFNFPFSEIDMGAVPANFMVQRYLATDTPPWSSPTMGTRTSTSTQVTGLSAVGAFAIGELKPKVRNEFIYLRENY